MGARRDQIPPNAPREPVGTRSGPLDMPTTAGIERSQVGQQPVGGCIEVRRLLGDPLAQLFELILHDNRISFWSDIEPAPHGASIAASTGLALCSTTNNYGIAISVIVIKLADRRCSERSSATGVDRSGAVVLCGVAIILRSGWI